MVYGKFFRKPFSKTRVRLPLKSRLSLCALSFSLCSLLFTVPSHRATPSHPNTLSHLAFSLTQLVPSQPWATSLSLSPISLLAPKPPSHRRIVAPKPPSHWSHSKGPPSIRRTDLYLTDLILIWSLFFFFSFNIWDLLIFFVFIWSDLFFFFFFFFFFFSFSFIWDLLIFFW